MESAPRKFASPAEARPSPDLVHLALILAGTTRVPDTLQKALRALQRAGPSGAMTATALPRSVERAYEGVVSPASALDRAS
jgi:hypothetical protein